MRSSSSALHALFQYQAWANAALFEKMEGFHAELHREELHTALRLVNHSYVVGEIFAAHLTGEKHGYLADNTAETPSLTELRHAVAVQDSWYLDYVAAASPDCLSAMTPFTFTDGDRGTMSREEMLTHVITHAIYHRGEVGRIMRQLSIPLPWDTFAVHLHETEPLRRSLTATAIRQSAFSS
jgi:uncharacterized damage-inducible protein DinB